MAFSFVDLLGSVIQSQNLMTSAENIKNKLGGDNIAASGIGALLGALTGKSESTTLNSIGGGVMGLLAMTAYKALKNAQAGNTKGGNAENEAEIIINAMIDAAKCDGMIDADEMSQIMNALKKSGINQDGMNYVIKKMQSPMETEKITAAISGNQELAAKVYSAVLLAINIDTEAENRYLKKIAAAGNLTSDITKYLELTVKNQANESGRSLA